MSDNHAKLISVFLAVSGAVAASSVWASDIVLSLEEPTANSTYTGVANIRGWVVGSAGIQRVELYVDGTLKTNIPVGGRRSDVGGSYPTYPNSSDSGFSMAYNYSNLNAGQHGIRVRAVDNEGASKDASATFNATRFDNPFISNPSSINLNAATVSHDSQSIVINNITADGKTYDIRLDWRTAIQNYAITQIVSTGGGGEQTTAAWLCSHSGAFRGSFSGGDNGPIGVFVDAKTGFVSGFALSNQYQELVYLNGSVAVNQNTNFVSGDASTGSIISGQFVSSDQIKGTWENTSLSISGTFSVSRIGSDTNVVYHFAAKYSGDDFGIFAFNIDDSNNVTGTAFGVLDNKLSTISGTVSGTSLTATASNGTKITGTLNKTAGTLSGSWSNAGKELSGSYSGSGCKFN